MVVTGSVMYVYGGKQRPRLRGVMGIPVHTAILNRTAKDQLKPLGVTQKGRSRFWYSDEGWCTIIAEFQPFRGQQGSSLNLGVHWLWYPKDYWSYDLGGRADEYHPYEGEKQFETVARELVSKAGQYVTDCRSRLSTLAKAYEFAAEYKANDWSHLHLAVLAALIGNRETAHRHLDIIYTKKPKYEWVSERNAYIDEMRAVLATKIPVQDWVTDKIGLTRRLLKLDENWKQEMPATSDCPS